MKTITAISDMQSLAETLRKEGKKLGFVPTMGFLHEGHLSLMRRAREECDVVVVSIFVNPTQFGPQEDFDHYPRDVKGDQEKCLSAGVDVLFLPTVDEMYPQKPDVFVNVEGVSDVLEGAIRPGHFRGVATVVAKLFNIVKPHRAYFGQKDYQQCVVIGKMVAGVNMDTEIVILPIVRQPDGLAMSSRNSYLSPAERKQAAVLYHALKAGEELIRAGVREPEKVRKKMRAVISQEKGVEIDYAEAADPDTLTPVEDLGGRIVLLVAVRLKSTRLIDNLLVL